MATTVMASIGDHGSLNAELPMDLQGVWIDRDLSWLDFNDRVLAEALDDRTPLLERAKFLAIFTSNLDEFFMKRQAILRHGTTDAQHTLAQELRDKIVSALRLQAECYRQTIIPGLAAHGVFLRRWDDLTPAQREEGSRYFKSELSPALTPLVIDPVHPFPFLSNLSVSLVFRLRDMARGETMFARVKVPGVINQWVSLQSDLQPGQKVLVPLYDVICGNLHNLYSGMEISDVTIVRLTRDAEVELDDEPAADFRAMVREQIRQRRYEPVVRLEFGPGADPAITEMLRARFDLTPLDLYEMPEEVDYTNLFELMSLPLPTLRDPDWTPLWPAALPEAVGPSAIFSAMQAGDFLVHHPYESFDASVEHFISSAADDPQTVSIKMTAYRIGDDTPFVKSLIRAAERGKQVACVMEIKARFDEERNLHWAAELERAGAHVTFGVSGLKTHAKTALVVRKESGGLRCYVHIGTGNYHVKTARLYADVGLFTCDHRITEDVVNLFHYLTGHAEQPTFDSLLVAPVSMRPRLLDLIHREINNKRGGKPARIIAKMNQLEDLEIIEALCAASNAGVPIDLVIRGFCCLRPGVAGHTENIRVRSIIGRFLEHSRIFYFANGNQDPAEGEYFIGSADWMYRNLSKRIEVVTPVRAAHLRQRLWEILDILLRDQRQAWLLESDGKYVQLRPNPGAIGPEANGTHQTLMDLARARAAKV
ncbi:MAG TPA: polyphosphate kinase 1 [Acidobacteriaceae bacterium]|nr:polyphosphate kinase 1 [Acidobacteriaceae bacterium]